MSRTWEVPSRVSEASPNLASSMDRYRAEWQRAADDPSGYWLAEARSSLQWRTPPTLGLEGDFDSIREEPLSWFGDGTLNVTESCVDRHAATSPDKVAILWEGDEPGDVRRITYAELSTMVNQAANALAALGIQKGERVIIYMGMTPEAAVTMLACARLGAIHSVVFGGFSAEALRDRVRDCAAEVVVTQDEAFRGGRTIPLKAVADVACAGESSVRRMLVLKRTGAEVHMEEGRDVWWHEFVSAQSAEHEAVECAAEDPLFVLYTSGSTGKPKGLVHTCGGYLTYAAYTHREVFDLRPDDVFACMADIGWITGHSYIVYGPLANGATTFMCESTPVYPDAGRYWDMVERHKITVFYTAPTALRVLAAKSSEFVTKYDRTSLRVLGTVGEPINPEAWIWYREVVGENRCTIVDTWWQTETGGIMLSPLAAATPTRPGSATFPVPGIMPLLVDTDAKELIGPADGHLCFKYPWPGQARTVWRDHARFVSTYFSTYPGRYFSGDGCRRDADGYYWITGRVDDVINVSGHRMGTAEFESAILVLDAVAEAAVVGYPHPIKGQGVFAFVVLQPDEEAGETFADDMNTILREQIGAHARLDGFKVIPALPKTRSGKVMRRIMRKVVEGRADELGDVSTLADPSVIDAIVGDFKRPS